MRVIKSQVKNSEYPKQTKCEYCGAELEYELQDEHIGWMGCKYITCPECNEESWVDENRVMEPNYPMTFHHVNVDNGAKEIGDKKTQEYVNEVVKYLIKNKDEYAASLCTGNTLVIGFNNGEDGIEIYVTKDYWEDMLIPEDYYMVK